MAGAPVLDLSSCNWWCMGSRLKVTKVVTGRLIKRLRPVGWGACGHGKRQCCRCRDGRGRLTFVSGKRWL